MESCWELCHQCPHDHSRFKAYDRRERERERERERREREREREGERERERERGTVVGGKGE